MVEIEPNDMGWKILAIKNESVTSVFVKVNYVIIACTIGVLWPSILTIETVDQWLNFF